MMVMNLLEDGHEAHSIWVKNGGVELVLGLVQQYTPESPHEVHNAGENGHIVQYGNPKFLPNSDLLEKACHCLAIAASHSASARQKFFEADGIKTTLQLVGSVKTPST